MAITINGSGTIGGVSVGGLPDGIVDTDMLAANAVSSAKLASGAGGKILQVLSTTKVDHFSTASGTFTDVTGLSQAITTSTSTNKVLVIVNMSIGAPWWTANPEINLVRGSTNLLQATGGGTYNATILPLHYAANAGLTGAMMVNQTICFLDSPGSAAAHTYKIQVKHIAVNKADNTDTFGSTSTITCMEVAA